MDLLRIKELQDQIGLTNVALADKVSVTPATISNINKGNNFPKPELLLKIAKVLNVDIRELFYPTKGFGESPEINGFVEYKKETFKINNYEDLTQLMEKVNKEC
jgi:DNA-binding XRE family transcriptional regulator